LARNNLSEEDRKLLDSFLNNKDDKDLLDYELWREQKKKDRLREIEFNSTYDQRSKRTKDAWDSKLEEEKLSFKDKMSIINNSEEHRNKSKESRQNEDYKLNMSYKLSQHCNNDSVKKKRSEDVKESWKNPDIRNSKIKSLKNTYATTDLALKHSEAMKSEKRKFMDRDVDNFKNVFNIFNIYDLIEYYKCSKDVAGYFILDLTSQNKLNKIGRIKGEGGKIYYEFCKN
jgi:hypothetical protein